MSSPADRTIFGLPKLPRQFGYIVTPFFLSILMTFIVSLVSTLRSIGLVDGFVAIWFQSWGLSWIVAFPTLLLVLPLVRKLTSVFVRIP